MRLRGKSRRTGKPARRFKIQKNNALNTWELSSFFWAPASAGLEFVLFRPRSQFLKLGRF
jgi:hypothetical protein